MSRVLFIAGVLVWTGACGTFDDQTFQELDCNCSVEVPWDWRLDDVNGAGQVAFRTGMGSKTSAVIRWYSKNDVAQVRSLDAQLDIGSRRLRRTLVEDDIRLHYVDEYLVLDAEGETFGGETAALRVVDMPDGWLVVQVNGSTEERAREDFRLVTGQLRRLDSRPDGLWDRFQGVGPAQTTLESPVAERVGHAWGPGQSVGSRSGLCLAAELEPSESECAARLDVYGQSDEGAVLLWLSPPGKALTSITAQPFVDAGLTVVGVNLLGTPEQLAFTSVLGPRLDDVLYAIDHVPGQLQLGDRPLFVGGEGAGGGAALLAAIERPELAGVLLLDPLVDVGPDAKLPEDTTLALMTLGESSERYALRSAIRYVSQLSVPTLVLTPEWSHGALDGERLYATAHESQAPVTVHRVPFTDVQALQSHAFTIFARAMSEYPNAVSNVVDARDIEQIGALAGEQYRRRLKQELLAEVAPLLRIGEADEGSVNRYVRSVVGTNLSRRHYADLRFEVIEEASEAKIRSEAAWPEVTDFDRLQTMFLALSPRGLFGPSTPEDCLYHGLAEAMHLYEEADEASRIGVVFYDAPAVEQALAGQPLRLHYRSPPGGSGDLRAIRAVLSEELLNAGLVAIPVPGMDAVDVSLVWQRRLSDEFWYD